MGKVLEGLEERSKVKIHIDSLRATLKEYQTEKLYTSMAYMDSG